MGMSQAERSRRYREKHREKRRERERIRNSRPEVKEQQKITRQKYLEANKEIISARRKKDRETEQYKQRFAAYQERYRERAAELQRIRWNNTDPEVRSQKAKEWREKNPEKVKEYKERYRSKNPDKGREYAKEWYYKTKAECPEKISASAAVQGHKRRAKKRSTGGSFTQKEIADLFVKQGKKCATCKEPISDKKGTRQHSDRYHIDHFKPLAKGGTSNIDNIVLLCRKCNQHKHKRDPEDFAKEHGLLFF